jgi:hypothetical protein
MKLPCCFGGLQRLRKKSSSEDEAATNLLQNQILQERPKCALDGGMATTLLPPNNTTTGDKFVDVSSRAATWYVPQLSAADCIGLLTDNDDDDVTRRSGRFLVRPTNDSRRHPSSDTRPADSAVATAFELFLRTEAGVGRYSIVMAGSGGLCFEGHRKMFPNISALVVHHSIMREQLPALLALPRQQQLQQPGDNSSHTEELEEEEIDFIDIDCDAEFSELVSRLQGQVSF